MRAPLGGRSTRVGLVVALREGDATGLRPIQSPVEPAPILSAGNLKLYKLGVHTFYRPRKWGDGADAPTWGNTQATAEAAAKL